MPITEECNVVKVRGSRAIIELVRKPECDGCQACAFNRRSSIKMTARKEVDCYAGDRVTVQMPEKTIKGSWLVLFVFPLALLIIAVCLTVNLDWYFQIAAVCAALLIGLGVAILCDFLIKRNSKYIPTIKEVITINKNHIGVDQ